MANPLSLLGGAGLGAGAMYLLDPDLGRRRRALLRDQLVHACSTSTKAADVVRRDAGNRFYGLMAELRSSIRHDDASDDILLARVRSKIGRCVSHPAAIEVKVADGRVTLSGPILADEVEQLVANVRGVRGVESVESALEVHEHPENVSALQGGRRRTGEPIDLLQENWSPTTRAAVGAVGLGLMASCMANRSPSAIILGTIGFALSAKAANNLSAARRGSFLQERSNAASGGARSQPRRSSSQLPAASQAATPAENDMETTTAAMHDL